MDLTFQVPIQYCSLQHQILLLSPDTSTTEYLIRFGPTASFILGLLVILCSSPVAYWTPSDLEDSSFGIISLAFYTVHEVLMESKEELKSFLMRVKEESERAGLRLNIKKTRSWYLPPLLLLLLLSRFSRV